MIKAKNLSNVLILVILVEKKLILVKIENFKGLINMALSKAYLSLVRMWRITSEYSSLVSALLTVC